MKMAIDVYEYGKGGKCVHMFTYVYEDLNLVPIVMGGFRTFCY